jgi:hypothetical protein
LLVKERNIIIFILSFFYINSLKLSERLNGAPGSVSMWTTACWLLLLGTVCVERFGVLLLADDVWGTDSNPTWLDEESDTESVTRARLSPTGFCSRSSLNYFQGHTENIK